MQIKAQDFTKVMPIHFDKNCCYLDLLNRVDLIFDLNAKKRSIFIAASKAHAYIIYVHTYSGLIYLLTFATRSVYCNFCNALYCKSINNKYLLDAVPSSGISKVKQKLGVSFNFDKQDVIDLTKFSKMTMCRASEANSEK